MTPIVEVHTFTTQPGLSQNSRFLGIKGGKEIA